MNRILVPIDGSAPADAALEYALERFPDDEIVALYVKDPVDGATAWGPGSADNWMAVADERAKAVLGAVTDRADERDVSLATDDVVGRPARAIIEYAEENDVDNIVIGSHGRDGVARVLLGSVAETVVRRAPVPVTVVRPRE